MTHVADPVSVSALEQQYRSCPDVTAARHLQPIWLLARPPHRRGLGHSVVCTTLGRASAGALQCPGSAGSGRPAAPHRDEPVCSET